MLLRNRDFTFDKLIELMTQTYIVDNEEHDDQCHPTDSLVAPKSVRNCAIAIHIAITGCESFNCDHILRHGDNRCRQQDVKFKVDGCYRKQWEID